MNRKWELNQRIGWGGYEEYAVISEPTSEGEIAQEAIREELSRILESSIFVQSDRLGRFLRYTVETTLAGDAETLKEYLIGTEVYHRKPPYHPSVDSIVAARPGGSAAN